MFVVKSSDIVDIVAPGYGESKENLAKCEDFIRSLGLTPRVPGDIFGKDLLCANSDEARFAALETALSSEDSGLIWCFKGGYGTTRLMKLLEKMRRPSKQKLVIGFSDITALHLFITQKWKWPALHAPVLWQIVNGKISEDSISELKQILLDPLHRLAFRDMEPVNISANKRGVIKAKITGGNLALIQCSLGTKWQIDTKGKILLLEEVGEKSYRVDRMLVHLAHAGVFDKAKAVIFGDFIFGEEESAEDKAEQKKLNKVVRRFAESLKIPAVISQHIGHGITNFPLPLGITTNLEFGKEVILRIGIDSDCYQKTP